MSDVHPRFRPSDRRLTPAEIELFRQDAMRAGPLDARLGGPCWPYIVLSLIQELERTKAETATPAE